MRREAREKWEKEEKGLGILRAHELPTTLVLLLPKEMVLLIDYISSLQRGSSELLL